MSDAGGKLQPNAERCNSPSGRARGQSALGSTFLGWHRMTIVLLHTHQLSQNVWEALAKRVILLEELVSLLGTIPYGARMVRAQKLCLHHL